LNSCCVFENHYDDVSASLARPCLTTKLQICRIKTKTDFFLVSDRSCRKTDGLRPHHCYGLVIAYMEGNAYLS